MYLGVQILQTWPPEELTLLPSIRGHGRKDPYS